MCCYWGIDPPDDPRPCHTYGRPSIRSVDGPTSARFVDPLACWTGASGFRTPKPDIRDGHESQRFRRRPPAFGARGGPRCRYPSISQVWRWTSRRLVAIAESYDRKSAQWDLFNHRRQVGAWGSVDGVGPRPVPRTDDLILVPSGNLIVCGVLTGAIAHTPSGCQHARGTVWRLVGWRGHGRGGFLQPTPGG